MKAMSAAEASRNFAAVLDQAERGETIVVTRGGKQIAVIGPAPTAPGRMVKAFLSRSAGTLDADFEADVAAAREATDNEGGHCSNSDHHGLVCRVRRPFRREGRSALC